MIARGATTNFRAPPPVPVCPYDSTDQLAQCEAKQQPRLDHACKVSMHATGAPAVPEGAALRDAVTFELRVFRHASGGR